MKVYRFNEKNIGKEASNRPAVIILSPDVSVTKAEGLIEKFPNALRVAESFIGTPPKEGYFNVLRVKAEDIENLDFDKDKYKAIIIEDAPTMFYSELLAYREEIAEKTGLSIDRVRFCCNLLSEKGCDNFSCYAANALRDYAAEVGTTGIAPTIKQEVLSGNSLCMCVKTRK